MWEERNQVARLVVGGLVLSNDFTGTFELAQWCKLLRDRGWTGQQVARSLGRSEGYVNNLIRILERASLEILARWKLEQNPASTVAHICATDWLMQVCVLPQDAQNAELAKRVARRDGEPAAPAQGDQSPAQQD